MEQKSKPALDLQPSSIALLSCLRSQKIKNIIAEGVASLEKKICDHENGTWELTPMALDDCKHDLTLLKILGAA